MKTNRKKTLVAREGLPFIFGFTLIGSLLLLLPFRVSFVFGWVSFAFALFCCIFFRDPEREIFQDSSFILAPGDGRILELTEETSPYFSGKAKVVKIFLSIFNVHIQRSPIAGEVKETRYCKGKFLDARHPRASWENENNSILIENETARVVVKQIAGLIARRIVLWVQKGQKLRAGEKLGLIRFGSQVDLFLPMDVHVCVSPGDRVVGGVTVIGTKLEKEKK
jgi:phosphatidylserine decarboxylase